MYSKKEPQFYIYPKSKIAISFILIPKDKYFFWKGEFRYLLIFNML